MPAHGSLTTALDDLRWLRRLAFTLARDADEADDLVQDTLVTAWREPPRDLTGPARPWLSTVLRNLWRMRRRSGARRERREQDAAVSGTPTQPEHELVRLEVLRTLVAALDRLDPGDRKIIVRRYFEGESAAEIARALAIPAATVRSRIHRSLKVLRAALDEKFDARSTWSAAILAGPPIFPTSPPKGDDMSIFIKTVLGAGIGAAGCVGWIGMSAQPESTIDPIESVEPVTTDPKMAWEQRRQGIRRVLPPLAIPTARDAGDREQREHDDFRELVRACLEDLESDASGALTLDVTEIGTPDIGTIYDSVEVVETTFADDAALQCVIQSMYAWVGEAPAENFFEKRYTMSFTLGTPTEELKLQRSFEAIIGAHIGEVRYCEKRGNADAPDVVGHLRLAFDLEADGRGYAKARAVTTQDTDLPGEVEDCIVVASRRWVFPATHSEKMFTYDFVLPVPGRGPR
ncbi:MAG TPA: sigma-70 family RNA polymerase sigma factor [Nannocystis sp.]